MIGCCEVRSFLGCASRYADDTLVVASSCDDWYSLLGGSEPRVTASLDETEVLLFSGSRMGLPSGVALVVEGEAAEQLREGLGWTLDSVVVKGRDLDLYFVI
ncbi:unnamed protein product [Pieris brassicae]|uniref:Uncharacterized protein n=1 Tax=Pieris brassicae TaxID=7116 RepID=A0A9P0T3E6_PIEBR|nr:unnamed protein product [Pieris brassicae]